MDFKAILRTFLKIIPVSYTHLDVYKRQRWEIIPKLIVRGQYSYRISSSAQRDEREAYNFFDYNSGAFLQTWGASYGASKDRSSYYYLGGTAEYTFERCVEETGILVRATFYAYVFQFFSDVETTFDLTTFYNVFQGCTHNRVTFSRFYMKKIDAEIELSLLHISMCIRDRESWMLECLRRSPVCMYLI